MHRVLLGSRIPRPQPRPGFRFGILLFLLAIVAAGLFTTPSRHVQAEPVAITEGYVDWGFKESWRNYIGQAGTTLSEGATWAPSGVYRFPIESGTYDDATRTTTLELGGRALFSAHDDILHMEVWDLRVVISPDEQLVWGHIISRDLGSSQIVDYGMTAIALLDVPSVDPVIAGGTTTWTAIPAYLTADAAPKFIGYYPVGQTLDPVTVVYTGPGGKPEAEVVTPPGTPGVEILGEPVSLGLNLSSAETRLLGTFYDEAHNLIHIATIGAPAVGQPIGPAVRARSVDTLAVVGTGSSLIAGPNAPQPAFDPATSTIFALTALAATPGVGTVTALTWDADSQTYVTEVIDSQLPTFFLSNFAWDGVGERLAAYARQGSGTAAVSFMRTWERSDEGWIRVDYALVPPPSAPTSGAWTWYGMAGSGLAAAPDGTFIVARGNGGRVDGSGISSTTLRLTLADGAVEVEELAGTQVPDTSSAPLGFGKVTIGSDGTVVLIQERDPHKLMVMGPQGGTYVPLAPLQTEALGRLRGADVDTSNGTVFVVDAQVGNLVVVRDGEIVLRQPVPGMIQLTEFLDVVVVDEGTVVVTTLVSPRTVHLTKLYISGSSPAIDSHPEDVVLDLSGGSSAPVQFQASASGDPAPDLQWQVRYGGAGVWQNIPGATSGTLAFQATPADNGNQYRLRATNAAGRNVSNPAALSVAGLPFVNVQPDDVQVETGEDAAFLMMPGGSPTPEVTWQRLVSGTWVDLSPSHPAYHIDGGFFTVLGVTEADDGAQFRARLTNSAGTIYSNIVTLTVGEGGGDPDPDPEGASQTILTEVLATGSLSLSVAGTQVTLPTPALNDPGDALVSSGAINEITVSDLRTANPGWSLSGQVSDFVSGSDSFGGERLGWTPEVVSQAASQNVVAGTPVAPGGSLGSGASLGSAAAGEGRGTAVLGAGLDLSIPTTTPAGTYNATLTITVI